MYNPVVDDKKLFLESPSDSCNHISTNGGWTIIAEIERKNVMLSNKSKWVTSYWCSCKIYCSKAVRFSCNDEFSFYLGSEGIQYLFDGIGWSLSIE